VLCGSISWEQQQQVQRMELIMLSFFKLPDVTSSSQQQGGHLEHRSPAYGMKVCCLQGNAAIDAWALPWCLIIDAMA
jgi:hypothetical protein